MANQDANTMVNLLFQELEDNPKYDRVETSSILTKIKILTREKSLQFNTHHLEILVQQSQECQLEAQKCFNNLILNYENLRQPLVELYVDCVYNRLTKVIQDRFDQLASEFYTEIFRQVLYFDLRIIYLLSAYCKSSGGHIRDRLLTPIAHIVRIETERLDVDNSKIINEGLRILFNLTSSEHFDEQVLGETISQAFNDLHHKYGPICTDNNEIYNEILTSLIELLTNMPKTVFEMVQDNHFNCILGRLDNQLANFSSITNHSASLMPILAVCLKICKFNENVRYRWFTEIIGSTKEFNKRPEEYDTLKGRLVKLMTCVDVVLKDIAADFLFNLCDQDVDRFVTYTGFGNAAAFLTMKGLLGRKGEGASRRTEAEQDTAYRELMDNLNPITGQITKGQLDDPLRGMTEEEKERSAHELAITIEKLSDLGVIKPMQVGTDGRVTELRPQRENS